MSQIIGPDGTYTAHYKRMCWNKYWYPDEVEAVRNALRLGNWEITHKKKFSAYPCEYCSGWHLTTKNPNITQASLKKAKRERCPTGQKKFTAIKQASRAAKRNFSSFCGCKLCGGFHVLAWKK